MGVYLGSIIVVVFVVAASVPDVDDRFPVQVLSQPCYIVAAQNWVCFDILHFLVHLPSHLLFQLCYYMIDFQDSYLTVDCRFVLGPRWALFFFPCRLLVDDGRTLFETRGIRDERHVNVCIVIYIRVCHPQQRAA